MLVTKQNKYYRSQWLPSTVRLPTFFAISSFVVNTRKKLVQVWKFLRVSKWWLHFSLNRLPFNFKFLILAWNNFVAIDPCGRFEWFSFTVALYCGQTVGWFHSLRRTVTCGQTIKVWVLAQCFSLVITKAQVPLQESVALEISGGHLARTSLFECTAEGSVGWLIFSLQFISLSPWEQSRECIQSKYMLTAGCVCRTWGRRGGV